MDNEMGRLILIPQYPTKLRYQEWWFTEFPEQFSEYFDSVLVLGRDYVYNSSAPRPEDFAPLGLSIRFETQQLKELFALDIKPDDRLLLCDMSYPGILPSALIHIDCKKYAICHATSRNRYDYFAKVRHTKWPIENATAKIFDKIFVGSQYHAYKIGWDNVVVSPLPLPRPGFAGTLNHVPYLERSKQIISVSRPTKQKTNLKVERRISKEFGIDIERPQGLENWNDYYRFLQNSKIMLLTSQEETFGYQVIDAFLNGVVPLAPNKYSYPELLSSDVLYNNIEELKMLITKWLNKENTYPTLKTLKASIQFYSTLTQHMKDD